ncbi:hypothetical protein D3C77_524690 [compost metagenome]
MVWLCGSSITRHINQAEQPSTNGAACPSTRASCTPMLASLSGWSNRLRVPTWWVSCACAAVGTWITNQPLPSTNCRVRAVLSSTTVTLGGSKSSAQAQAAAITLSTPSWLADTSTVGPWFSRR